MSTVVENYDMIYDDKEYQYTLYYYDQAGNLIQTIAPEGVSRYTPSQLSLNNTAINNARRLDTENTSLVPTHTLKTEYKYNSLNQLVWQNTPDGGITKFAYDALGRIIASQNAKQSNLLTQEGYVRFSYTKYDNIGRIIEAGEVHPTTDLNYFFDNQGKLNLNNLVVNEFDDSIYKTEVTKTVYDLDPLVETYPSELHASDLFITNTAVGFTPSHNNRNRVTGIYYYKRILFNIT